MGLLAKTQVALRHQRAYNLRDYMDGDAAEQPGALQDVLLHETAVSWVRNSLKTSLPQKPWEESREAFGARLRDAAREANTKYDVDGLCILKGGLPAGRICNFHRFA